MKVTVHNFRVYDGVKDDYHYPPLKSTEERIQRIGGQIIPNTAQVVESDQLDDDGRYVPKPSEDTNA